MNNNPFIESQRDFLSLPQETKIGDMIAESSERKFSRNTPSKRLNSQTKLDLFC